MEHQSAYRREIDGLRALALLPVMTFHANPNWLSGGFVGVDVFFVISGYLITALIVRDLERGNFSFANFYERRVRRIAPALLVVLSTTTGFAAWWLLPEDFQAYCKSLVATLLFMSNVLFWRESGYFDTAAELKPLLHTWSLSIEEQFYLFFPMLLILAWKMGRRCLSAILLAFVVLGLVMAERRAVVNPLYTYYLLPTRGWELLIGSLTALWTTGSNSRLAWPHPRMKDAVGALGLAMIAFAAVSYSKKTPFPGMYALVPTIGAALVIAFATAETWPGRLLSTKLLVGVGLISYSAYLWHFPLYALARYTSLTGVKPPWLGALGLLALLLAWLSWRCIEKPFRRPRFMSRNLVFATSALWAGVLLLVGFIGVHSPQFASRERVIQLPHAYHAEASFAFGPLKGVDGAACISSETASLCQVTAESAHQRIFLIGDSHSADLNLPWRRFLAETSSAGWQLSLYSCAFASESEPVAHRAAECGKARDLVERKAHETKFDVIVVATNLYGHFGQFQEFESSFQSYENFLMTLAASGARVIVLAPRPVLNALPIRAAILDRVAEVAVVRPPTSALIDQRLRALEASGLIEIFDQAGVLVSLGCGEASCFNGHTLQMRPIYRDTNHLTDYGAEQVVARLAAFLRVP